MWCKNCNIETNEEKCPICGTETVEDIPTEVLWCEHCKTPVIQEVNQVDKGICPICGNKMKYMATDIRPVFPEERLMLEILLGNNPNEFVKKSVWAENSRYFIDGKSIALPSKLFKETETTEITKKINQYKGENTYEYFDNNMKDYFFYDGENNVIDKVSSKSNLKTAIEKMMGINEINDLADYFDPKLPKSVFRLLNDELAGNDEDDDEFVQYRLRKELQDKSEEVEKIDSNIKNNKQEIEELESNKTELENFIKANKETQEMQEELNRFKRNNKRILSNYKAEFQEKIRALNNPKNGNHLLLEGLFDKCFEKYDFNKIKRICSFDSKKSLSHITEDVIDQLIERGFCLCGAPIESENDAYKHLLGEKEHMEPNDFGRYLSDFLASESGYKYSQRNAMYDFKDNLDKDFLETLDKYEDNKRTINELSNKLVNTKDIGSYQTKINEISKNIGTLEERNRNEKEHIDALNVQIQKIQQDIQKNAKDTKQNKFIKECLAYASSIHKMAYAYVSKSRKNVRDALESKTNELFCKMYHGNRSIKIGQDFTVMTITDEKELDNSTGIDTVKNFAFVAGMMQTAKQHIVGDDDFEVSENDIYPLVIDAPFSNTDTEHIKNICDVLPECCDQLIMCMINKDYQIAENDIKDRINKVYKINKLSETEDKIEEVK